MTWHERIGKIEESLFFKILEILAKLSILVAIVTWIFEIPNRSRERENLRKAKIFRAWELIALSEVQSGSAIKKLPLEELNSEGVDLRNLSLDWSFLEGVQLPGASLDYSTLWHSDLTDANLKGTSMQYCDIVHTKIGSADLSQCDFSYSLLNGLNFSGANVTDATFSMALLWNCDLSQAIGLQLSQLTNVVVFRNTVLPSHMDRTQIQWSNDRFAKIKSKRNNMSEWLTESPSVTFDEMETFINEGIAP
jgi:uncharacterized protein YjbI with pentapeptide repeats